MIPQQGRGAIEEKELPRTGLAHEKTAARDRAAVFHSNTLTRIHTPMVCHERRAASRMEAGRIELPSQDITDVGLYMLRRWFVVVPRDGHRHSSRGISRLYLAGCQRPNIPASPLFSASASRTSALCRDHLFN